MATIGECVVFSPFALDEIIVGARSSNTHRVLLSSYLLNLWRVAKAVREMIVADMRLSLDLGMIKHAADLLLVLRRFLSDYPESRLAHRSREGADGNVVSLSHRHE